MEPEETTTNISKVYTLKELCLKNIYAKNIFDISRFMMLIKEASFLEKLDILINSFFKEYPDYLLSSPKVQRTSFWWSSKKYYYGTVVDEN